MKTAGYSGTPLIKKLGIKPNDSIFLFQPPGNYFHLLGEVPESCRFYELVENEEIDLIHVFCFYQKEVIQVGQKFKNYLKKNGAFWVSWPKMTSKRATNLNCEKVCEIMLRTGFVDVKVAAIDEDWSGLKFVFRLKNR